MAFTIFIRMASNEQAFVFLIDDFDLGMFNDPELPPIVEHQEQLQQQHVSF